MAIPPWIWALIILAILLIAFGIGWLVGKDGSPADSAADRNSGILEDGDCIVVIGDLVYDAGHCEGWHEIHPVKRIHKICAGRDDDCLQANCLQGDLCDPAFRDAVINLVDRWCKELRKADSH